LEKIAALTKRRGQPGGRGPKRVGTTRKELQGPSKKRKRRGVNIKNTNFVYSITGKGERKVSKKKAPAAYTKRHYEGDGNERKQGDERVSTIEREKKFFLAERTRGGQSRKARQG